MINKYRKSKCKAAALKHTQTSIMMS